MRVIQGMLEIALAEHKEANLAKQEAHKAWSQALQASYRKIQKEIEDIYPSILGVGHEQILRFCDGDDREFQIPSIVFAVDKTKVPDDARILQEITRSMPASAKEQNMFTDKGIVFCSAESDRIYGTELLTEVLGIPEEDLVSIKNSILSMVNTKEIMTVWWSEGIILCRNNVFEKILTPFNY
jgi:hypothetical protein